MKAIIVANPVAGPAWQRLRQDRTSVWLHDLLDRHAADIRMWFTEGPAHAPELARRAVDDGADVVIAWGGDGTVNEVASALIQSRVSLGIVPVGSGNGLARELGIPSRSDEALRVALSGADRLIDLGELNDRVFFNCSGIGFDAHVAHVFAASAGRVRGFMSYAAAAVREGLRYEAGSYRVEADGLPGAEFRAFLITVANTRQWGNGALIAPNARMDDDRLDMVVIPESSPLSLVANAWRLFAGSMADWPGVRMHQVRAATITATPPAPVHIDGEPIGRLSTVEVRVRPAALRVRVPITQ